MRFRFSTAVDFLWRHVVLFLVADIAVVVVAFVLFARGGANGVPVVSAEPMFVVREGVSEASSTPEVTPSASPEATVPARSAASVTANPSATVRPTSTSSASASPVPTPSADILPTRIVIARIGVDAPVRNPSTTNLAALNDVLTRAVVRYPGSGTIASGNMLIIGHSSELPVVRNQMYKVFSKLKTLVAGDEITVYAGTASKTYRVRSVRMLSVNDSDAYVSFGGNGLTLVTCNVLGQKEERFVVSADLI